MLYLFLNNEIESFEGIKLKRINVIYALAIEQLLDINKEWSISVNITFGLWGLFARPGIYYFRRNKL